IARKHALYSPYFENAYGQLANSKPLTDELITTAPVTYIIVSDPMFENALQPFINWKTRKGFKVVEAYTNDPAVGTSTASIKSYLQAFYNNPPTGFESQSFVLIVGDVAQVPTFNGTAGSHPTDLYFFEYTGDKIPECYYGRFSANSLVQLQPQIDKTLEYEQYLFPDESFLGEVVMVAGADPTYGPLYGNGQINYGTTYYFNTAHGILSHTYLQPEPSGGNYSTLIRQNVSNGVAFANYTAHCNEQGWCNPSFYISHIPNLQNNQKYCLMVGNCCLSNRFNTTCFGEEVLRASGKGALGYIGGTNNTYWDEDYWWGVGFKSVSTNPPYNPNRLGAYDVTFHDHGEAMDDWYVTQGQMVVGGNLAVQQSGSGLKTYYWEIYHLMGDPSLMIYMSIPPPITAAYQDPILIGTISVDITTEPYAYIGLSKDGDTFVAAACADSAGAATLTFDTLNNPGYLGIVITKQNFKPLIDSIQIIQVTGPYLILTSFTVNDSVGGNNNNNADFSETITLDVNVSNIGVATAYNISATLTTTDTNIVVTDNFCMIDSVVAGGSTICADAFAMTINNYVEDQHVVACEILFDDGSESWTSDLLLTLNAPFLVVNGITVVDPTPGGNNNGLLDPGESAILRVETQNVGHAGVGNGVGHLYVQPASTPYIIVNSPNRFIGNLPVNTIVQVDFPVITNGITPIGTIVNLNYNETAGQQNQYAAQKVFEIEIGAIPTYLMQNGNQTTCNARFYDSGGANANYNNNENFNFTFYPGTTGAHIEAEFTEFDVEPATNCNYDYLSIYNGNSTTAPLIGTYCGTTSPDTVESTAADGSLTFKFHSDYYDTYPGWASRVRCAGGPLTVMANAFPSTVCEGSTSILSAIPSGGTGTYTYLWEPATYLDDPTSQFPLCTPETSISYTVTISDGDTTITSAPVEVTLVPVPGAPVATLNGDLLESSATEGNQWYYNGAAIQGANQQTYQPTLFGAYYVTVTDEVTECESEPSNTIQYYPTAIDNTLAERMVTVYPNPFTDRLNILYTLPEPSSARIILSDAFGRLIRVVEEKGMIPAGNHTIVLESGTLKPGLYYCRVQTDYFTVVRKIILTR
ncbi:MAG: C25 family cysteine peptidase, partial [Bacteroidota bacterium]